MPISNGLKAASISVVFTAVLLFEGCSSSSQTGSYSGLCFYYYAVARTSLPEFDTDIFRTPDSAGQRLDIYLGLRESRLKYEKIGNAYRATYTTAVRITRKDEPEVRREVQRVVWKPHYPTSTDSSYDAFLLSFRAYPGRYSVEITLTDDVGGTKAVHRYEKTVPSISDMELSMSDILLLAKFDTVGRGRKITPFILSNAGLLPDTLKFFTVLLARMSSRDTVLFNVSKLESHERLPSEFGGMVFSARGANYDPCRTGIDTIPVYSYSVPVELDSGYTYVFGGVPKPAYGNYLLKVSVLNGRRVSASAVLPFHIKWRYFPDITEDLSQMVSSLRYIASKSELERITKVRTDSSIKASLLKFWADYGGNTKMADYYHRVSQANELFSTCIDGWRTPMGMFFIICGPPDYVECRGVYSERWVYMQASTNRFVQVDFRLVRDTKNPADRYYGVENLYSNLDFWSYYVARWRTTY